MEDVINAPSHYVSQGIDGLEPIDLLENYAGNIFNMLKYVIRAGHKAGNTEQRDLEKAHYYCKRAIRNCEKYGIFYFHPNCLHSDGLTISERKLIDHFEQTNNLLNGLFDYKGRISVASLFRLQLKLEKKLEEIKNGTQD